MPRTATQNQTASVSFNGNNTRGTLASATGVSGLTSSICVGGWFKFYPTKTPGGSTFPAAYNIGGSSGPFSYVNLVNSSQRLNFHLTINGTLYDGTVGSAGSFAGKWFHSVMDFDGTTLRGYLNGALVATGSVSGAITLTDNSITVGGQISSNAFWGNICQFFVSSHLSAQQIAGIAANGTYPSGLVGLYYMNEGSGTTLYDNSGNGNNLTLSNGLWTNDVPIQSRTSTPSRFVPPLFPCSLFFNGSAQVTGTGVSLANSDFTIMFWCKCSPHATYNMVYSLGSGATTDNALQCQFKTPNQADLGFFGDDYIVTTGGVLDNQWHFWAFCFQTASKTKSIYRDGTFVGSATSSGQFVGNTSFAIGSAAFAGDAMVGSVCGLYIYNSLLSQSQIIAAQNGNYPAGAVGVYRLSEGAGAIAYDSSGNGNNGTITSATYVSDFPGRVRDLVGGNLAYNPGFEFAPPTNVAMVNALNWFDGTSGGSSTNSLFGWRLSGQNGGHYSGMFDSANSHTGNYSLKISTTAINCAVSGGNGSFGSKSPYSINISPSTSYTLTFWMKTVANSGSANTGAYFEVREYSGSNLQVGSHTTTGVTTTTGWTQYKIIWTTASTCSYLMLVYQLVGNDGTATLIMDAWFDDIFLQQTALLARGMAV